jgi:hypothetical protein
LVILLCDLPLIFANELLEGPPPRKDWEPFYKL